jgi:hypothetical protein
MQLADARLQCHHALQLLTRIARGYLPAAPDDSHTNLKWDAEARALTTRPVGGREFALRLDDLCILWRKTGTPEQVAYPLNGRTLDEASMWVAANLQELGLPAEPYFQPLHFEIPVHGVGEGGTFVLHEDSPFEELARYYNNAALVLAQVHESHPESSDVRCWPHHFDIATLLTLDEGRTIGCGMSPGDEWYHQPYFYVNCWPYPDPASLPPPAPGSDWHTQIWTGAVLTAENVVRDKEDKGEEQEALVRQFYTQTVAGLRALQR